MRQPSNFCLQELLACIGTCARQTIQTCASVERSSPERLGLQNFFRFVNFPTSMPHPIALCRKVWEENFRDHLVIRPKSQHKACSLCIRYKLLLRRLQYQPEAKAEQMRLYRAHLEKHYADRTTYWGSRALSLSRMGLQSTGERLIVLTLDSVDHAKFAVPRDLSMQSKCFSNFVRPSLCCTGVLIHGYGVVLVLGQPFTRQDSSWTCDIIGYCLNLLSQLPPDQCNLPASSIILQGDNSSKELKNNSVMRLLSGAVACRRVQKAQLRTLQAGHSHEDLGQFFSSLCDRISSSSSLHTPTDFVDNLQSWLATVRPLEPMKKVVLLDQVRSWRLALILL